MARRGVLLVVGYDPDMHDDPLQWNWNELIDPGSFDVGVWNWDDAEERDRYLAEYFPEERGLVADLAAALENVLLHHGDRMSQADREARWKLVERARRAERDASPEDTTLRARLTELRRQLGDE